MNQVDLAHALSSKVGWPHTRDEWSLMHGVSTPVTVGSETDLDAIAMVTKYAWGAALGMVLVDPDKQRHGIGMTLTRRIMGMMDKDDAGTVTLTASHAAEHLYRKVGFEQVGTVCVLSLPARDDASSLIDQPVSGITGKSVSESFYDSCAVREKILDGMMAGEGVTAAIRPAGRLIESFASSVLRRNSNGEESLAVGPVLTANGLAAEAGNLLDHFMQKTAKKLGCFIYQGLTGEEAVVAQARRETLEVFAGNGFTKVDELPFMSYKGKPAPFLNDARIVSPMTLAFS